MSKATYCWGASPSSKPIQLGFDFYHPPVQAVYTAWTALMEGHDLAVPPLGEFAAWAPQPAQVMAAWPHGRMARWLRQYKSYPLNDRHWGKLQGRSEKDLEQSYDKDLAWDAWCSGKMGMALLPENVKSIDGFSILAGLDLMCQENQHFGSCGHRKEHLKNWMKDAPPPLEHSNVQHPMQDPLYRLGRAHPDGSG
jgi:hypothetical protein